ncbi:MAG: hypothetical protein NTW61_08125 [Candidatus Melainabacteria bacterium]|nr:hypothetical protein [Candidatus Melainabacteria bacterium]
MSKKMNAITIQLPTPPYEANAVDKAFVGQLQPDPKFLPQLKSLKDRFEADMKNLQQITPSVGKERVLNLPSFEKLRNFVAKNLGQLAHKQHEAALLDIVEPRLLISSAMKERGVINKLNLWTAGFVASFGLAVGGVMTENVKVFENGVLGTIVTAVGAMRSATFQSIGEGAIEKIAKSGGLPRV